MSDTPAFGFDGLDTFKPKPRPKAKTVETPTEEIDAAGETLGFHSRGQELKRRKKKGVTKPVEQFNIRAHIEDINRFVAFAEQTNKSYREVFSELVKKLPKS